MNENTMIHVGDGLSLAVLLGYFTSVLPIIALVFTIIWTGMRIYESYLNIKKLKREQK